MSCLERVLFMTPLKRLVFFRDLQRSLAPEYAKRGCATMPEPARVWTIHQLLEVCCTTLLITIGRFAEGKAHPSGHYHIHRYPDPREFSPSFAQHPRSWSRYILFQDKYFSKYQLAIIH